MKLSHLDHFVLTVVDIEKTCEFYKRILGMQVISFTPKNAAPRKALKFGNQKINLHQAGKEFEPKAKMPKAGSADFCLIAITPIDEVILHLNECNVIIEDGPVERTGATGAIRSVYFRDPDGNLIEVSNGYSTH